MNCSVCGEILVEQEEIPAAGHVYDDEFDRDCNVCGEERETGFLRGDANGDGTITSRDATRVLQYLTDLLAGREIDLVAADFNGDGKVSSRDATAILRYLIGG